MAPARGKSSSSACAGLLEDLGWAAPDCSGDPPPVGGGRELLGDSEGSRSVCLRPDETFTVFIRGDVVVRMLPDVVTRLRG
jgi:hypothetical protein